MIDDARTSFLDLPPELRNTVYELTLVSETPIKPFEDRQQPTISKVCRQVRAESLPVYYSLTHSCWGTFTIHATI